MRTGVQTSEFKMAVATVIGVFLTKALKIEVPATTLIEIVGVVMSYIVSRGLAKK